MSKNTIVMAALLVVGCGGAGDDKPGGADTAETTSATTITTSTESPTTTPGEVDTMIDSGSWSTRYDSTVWEGVVYDCFALTDFDDEDDGRIESRELSVYDGFMNATHREYDDDNNRSVDATADWEYDAKGEQRLVSSYDNDGDGDADEIYTSTYRPDGELETYAVDEDGDGDLEALWTYVYVDGVRTSIEVDEDDDGSVDLLYTYTRDEFDRTVLIEGDEGLDGTVNEVYEFEWLSNHGDDERPDDYMEWIDYENDGSIDETLEVHYDAEGNYVYYSYDVPDFSYTADYEWDGELLVGMEGTAYQYGDWAYDFTYIYTYDGDRLLEGLYEYDLTGTGSTDYAVRETNEWTCP
jgi:hypothetical protein